MIGSGTGRATLRTGQKRPCLLFSPLLPSERDAEKRKNNPSPVSSLLPTIIPSSPQGKGGKKKKEALAQAAAPRHRAPVQQAMNATSGTGKHSSFFTHNPSAATFPTPGAQSALANARASREKNGPDRGGRNGTRWTNPKYVLHMVKIHRIPHPRFRRKVARKTGEAGGASAVPSSAVWGWPWVVASSSRQPGAAGGAGGSPHRTAQARAKGGGAANRPRQAGEIRTARSRTHAKQRPHKCGFGAVRAGVNCPPLSLLPRRLRGRERRRRRTQKNNRSRRAPPSCHCQQPERSLFWPRLPLLPLAHLPLIQCHYNTLLLRASGSAHTTRASIRHRCCRAGSSSRSHCDLASARGRRGVVRVLRDLGSAAARWPGVEAAAAAAGRSMMTSRRTPSRTSSRGSPTASPVLRRGVSLPSHRFLLGSGQLAVALVSVHG